MSSILRTLPFSFQHSIPQPFSFFNNFYATGFSACIPMPRSGTNNHKNISFPCLFSAALQNTVNIKKCSAAPYYSMGHCIFMIIFYPRSVSIIFSLYSDTAPYARGTLPSAVISAAILPFFSTIARCESIYASSASCVTNTAVR